MSTNNKTEYSTLKWGIAGAGKISADFVAAVMTSDASSDKHRFLAVASKSLKKAQEFSQKFNISTAYGSYEQLAKDQEIRVIYVGNLNHEHYETTKMFLEHGKNVLIEKPMTINAKETESLTKLAQEKKLFLMEALWSKFLPSYQFVKEKLSEKAIGNVLYASACFGTKISHIERINRKEFGGGTILDIAIYTLNILQMAFGDLEVPEKIFATGNLSSDGIDLNMSAVLNYPSGATGVISTHSNVQLINEAIIVGTKGYIKMCPWFHCCTQVVMNEGDDKPEQIKEFPLPSSQYQFNYRNSVGLMYEADEVRNVLMNGQIESKIMSHRHSIVLARIMDEIRLQLGVKFQDDQ